MSEESLGRNSESASSNGADFGDIPLEILVKRLSPSYLAHPLKDVEEIVISELPIISRHSYSKDKAGKRGRKSQKEWTSEVRRAWGNLHDEDELAKSWLAMLPRVQNLAASKSGGRTTGLGSALQELLKKALAEVQEYDMEDQTREILKSFPSMKMKDIASKLGLNRSYVSRNYTTKAVSLLTKAFQRVTDKLN